jgi:MFS family permease
MGYLRTLRRLGRDVHLFLLTSALVGLTVFGGISAVLMNLYLLRLGYGPEFIGVFIASGNIAFAAVCLPAGALGARLGCRTVLVIGLVAASLGGAATALSELIPESARAAWLIGANLLGAAGMATYLVNSSPFLMASTTVESRALAFSAQSALWPLAAFVGSLLGGLLPGLLAGPLGSGLERPTAYAATLLVSALLLLPGALALLAARDPEDDGAPELETPAPATRQAPAARGSAPLFLIGAMSAVVLLQIVGEGVARSFINVYMDTQLSLPTAQIGLILAVSQLVAAPAALAAPSLADRYGPGPVFAIASALMALCLLPLALIPSWFAASAGFLGVMVMAAVARPVLTVLQMELVAPRWRPAMSGAGSTAAGASLAAVGFGGGLVIAELGYSALYMLGGGLTLAGALVFWLTLGRRPAAQRRGAPARAA